MGIWRNCRGVTPNVMVADEICDEKTIAIYPEPAGKRMQTLKSMDMCISV